MKKRSIFKKKNLSLLYIYLLSEKSEETERLFAFDGVEEKWFENLKKKRDFLESKINFHMKNGWNLARIPTIERAIIIIASYEIIYLENQRKEDSNLINRVVEFSKKYLDIDKFKYMNAVLDSLAREKVNAKKENAKIK